MKKSLILMAMAGVALAGCVNDVADVQQQGQKAKISFDSPVMYGNVDSRLMCMVKSAKRMVILIQKRKISKSMQ